MVLIGKQHVHAIAVSDNCSEVFYSLVQVLIGIIYRPFLVIRVILSTRMIIHIRRLYAAESAPTSVSGHWATSVLV